MAPDAAEIKGHARQLGFDLCGVAPLGPFLETDAYATWLDAGFAGTMQYLHRVGPRLNPEELLPGARSVVVCAVNYNTAHGTERQPDQAWVSRYAWGEDYHHVVLERLRRLAAWIESDGSGTRCYVDTGPLIERVFARHAGLGWFGKNTMLIREGMGSWLFLGVILTTATLPPDVPPPDRCGTCTRCIDACPTDAIVEPYRLDSRRCISYTTIERRGEIPEADRRGIGAHLFGCDICQDVCPWNRRAPAKEEPAFQPRTGLRAPGIVELLELDEEGWRLRIRGTALKRAKVQGLMRNALIVAANSGDTALIPHVERFLTHPDDVIRSTAVWAMAELRSPRTFGDRGAGPTLSRR